MEFGSSQPGCRSYLASLLPAPASSEERKMTAGSGRRLCGCLKPSDPLGPFSRILLESETWASLEFCLKWKLKTTQCGCLVFQLVPSTRRTGGNDTGLFASHWPTPQQSVPGQGDPTKRGLKIQTILKAKEPDWPTPRSEDSESAGAHRGTPDTLTSAAKSAWATPKKQNERDNGEIHGDGGLALGPQASGNISSGCLARTETFVVRLEILSAWLMGYPWSYLKNWGRRGDKPRKNAKSIEAY